MKKVFKKIFGVRNFLFCIDHEIGAQIIAVTLLLLTAASLAIYAFLVSIHAIYWQVQFIIITANNQKLCVVNNVLVRRS